METPSIITFVFTTVKKINGFNKVSRHTTISSLATMDTS